MIAQNHYDIPRVSAVLAQTQLDPHVNLLNLNNAVLHLYFSEILPCLPNDLNSTAVLTNKTVF